MADSSYRSSERENLKRAVVKEIGDHLRLLYDDYANRPPPARLIQLLNELDTLEQKEQSGRGQTKGP